MIKNDYLASKIKLLSEIVAKVQESNNKGDFEESHEVIAEAFKQLTALKPELAETLSYKDLMNFIGAYETAESIKLMILAELLRAYGELIMSEGDIIRSLSVYLKSLNIYVNAALIDYETCVEFSGDKIEGIIEIVNQYEIPEENKYYIFRFYELSKRYDKAENTLFEIIDSSEEKKEYIKEGINFYNRLSKKPSEDLEEGGLPFEEIEEGLESLKEMI